MMKRTLLAATAIAIGMAFSAPAMAGAPCKVPAGALKQLEKGDFAKYLNILVSANTNVGGGNGTEAVFLSGAFGCVSGGGGIDSAFNVDANDGLAPLIATDPGNSNQDGPIVP
jgi:hypothetical protein